MTHSEQATKLAVAWQAIRRRFTCWRDAHDWEQAAFDVGRCLRCDVELKTADMRVSDMLAFIRRFRRVG